jgi:hypothetical protein
MSVPARWVAAALAAVAVAMGLQLAPVRPGAEPRPPRTTFAYGPRATAADQQLLRDAVAVARPEARRLIARVAPFVEVSFDGTDRGTALGVTRSSDGRDFSVDIDVGGSMAAGGRRAVERVILHELGHVVDFALLSEDLRERLDAQFPTGYACPPEGCADRRERFAETFAKWALGDIGASLYVGYAVPPPVVTLDRWGEPLATMAAG